MKKGVFVVASAALLIYGCAGLRVGRSFKISLQDWTTLGGSPSRANCSSARIVPPLDETWQYNSVGGVLSTPLVRDSTIVLGTLNGEIQAINLVTGKRIGYLALEGPVVGTPAWDGSNVVVPISTSNASLVCVSLDAPERLWSADLGPIESSPLLYEKFIYVTTLEGQAFALKRDNGSEVWKYNTAPKEKRKPIRSSPATDHERIYFGSDDGCLYAVDRNEGKIQWKYQSSASIFASPIVSREYVIVGSLDGQMYCLDSRTGVLRWKFDTKSVIYGSASSDGDAVYFGSAGGMCYSVDVSTGALVWKTAVKSVINSAPLIAGDVLYLGSLDKTLYGMQASTGKILWQYTAPGRIRVSPVLWGNVLLVASEDRYLTALKPREVL